MYLVKQDADEYQCTLGQSSVADDILPAESQGNGDQLPSSGSLDMKGKILESGMVESSGQEKLNWKKNGMSNDIITPVLETDRQAKIKAQTIRSRQTQSGPPVSSAVLVQLPSEKWCTSGRFLINFC